MIIRQSLQHPFLQRVEEKLSNRNPCPCGLRSHSRPCGFRNIQPKTNFISFIGTKAGQEDREHRKWEPHEASTPASSPQAGGESCRPPALKPFWCLDPSLLPRKMLTAPTWEPSLAFPARMLGQLGEPLEYPMLKD